MILRRLVAVSIFTSICVWACGPTIHPPTGPGTEYPCGIQGKSCDPVAPGACCSLDEDCGYDGPWSTCPAGYCCYNGGADTRYPGSAKKKPASQWKPGSSR